MVRIPLTGQRSKLVNKMLFVMWFISVLQMLQEKALRSFGPNHIF